MDNSRKTIRVLIFHPQALFRATLSQFLASSGFEVVGQCESVSEVLEAVKRAPPEVVVVDSDTETGDLTSAARQVGYDGHVLLLAGAIDPRKSAMALKMGASGILLKSEPPERLAQAICALAAGGTWIDHKVIEVLAGELVDRAHSHIGTAKALESRERVVLLGIIQGLSNKGIGETMGMSESSVKNTVQRLFAKAGVKTRSMLVRMALQGHFGTIDGGGNILNNTNHGLPDSSVTPQSRESRDPDSTR